MNFCWSWERTSGYSEKYIHTQAVTFRPRCCGIKQDETHVRTLGVTEYSCSPTGAVCIHTFTDFDSGEKKNQLISHQEAEKTCLITLYCKLSFYCMTKKPSGMWKLSFFLSLWKFTPPVFLDNSYYTEATVGHKAASWKTTSSEHTLSGKRFLSRSTFTSSQMPVIG